METECRTLKWECSGFVSVAGEQSSKVRYLDNEADMCGPKEGSPATPQTAEGPGHGEAFSAVPYWRKIMMLWKPDQALEAEWEHLAAAKSSLPTSGDGALPQPEGLEQESTGAREMVKGLQATPLVPYLSPLLWSGKSYRWNRDKGVGLGSNGTVFLKQAVDAAVLPARRERGKDEA